MSSEDYATLAEDLRRPLEAAASTRATELVRAAALAANGHNTQPWRFKIGDSRIAIRPVLDRLAEAGRRDGVECRIFASDEEISKLCDLVVEANTEQLEEKAFVSELCDWIRFNAGQALTSRDGLYSGRWAAPACGSGWGAVSFPSS